MKLWMRVGDGGGYEEIESAQEVADALGPLGVGTVERYGEFGIQGDGFLGPYNYISLYWGDDDANGEESVDDEFIAQINSALDHYFKTGAFA